MATKKKPVAQADDEQSGYREGKAYALLPVTEEDRKNLLSNPDKPAEYQAAPAQEILNPHLFG